MRDFLRRLGLPDDPGTRLLALKALLAEAEKTGWAVGVVASKRFWPPRSEQGKVKEKIWVGGYSASGSGSEDGVST